MTPSALTRPVTRSAITRALLAGFAVVIFLLLAAGLLGVRNISAIQSTATRLSLEQKRTTELLEAVLGEQRALSAVYANILKSPEAPDEGPLLDQLAASRADIAAIVRDASGEPEHPAWAELESAIHVFVTEASEQLRAEKTGPLRARELLGSWQRVDRLVARLVETQTAHSLRLKLELQKLSERLLRESAILMVGGLLFAVLFAFVTYRYAGRLIRELETQTAELGKVSWQLLEKQEVTAKRFSHELHDELGQSLTAMKANLVAVSSSNGVNRDRLDDCMHLVDEAIVNVREMSQLLRPTLLDDFGLAASLRWLCERYRQRTGLRIEFHGPAEARFSEEVETHLFRIAQEALTNVARHAAASSVDVTLRIDEDGVALSIRDDGRGVEDKRDAEQPRGLGMVGMRARARSAGGELKVRSEPGKGTLVEAILPGQPRPAGKVA